MDLKEKQFKETSLEEFVEMLSAKLPAPGGGGAAAYAAAMGAALCAMVCQYTLGKKRYQEHETLNKTVLETSKRLAQRLVELVDEDKENFLPLSKAYGLPADTSEQKEHKQKVMEEALMIASKGPLELVEKTVQALKLHQSILGKSSTIVVSDIGVGAQLLRGAVVSGQMSVFINTGMMQDQEKAKKIEQEIKEQVKVALEMADQITEQVLAQL